MVGFLGALVFRSFAEIADDVRVDVDSGLTYYLSVKEDGVDASGVESSDAQMANVFGGRVSVTDQIPNGLEFQSFVTTSDGTFGAVSRADKTTQCAGKVIDDTNEAAVDTGTWNNGHTEYYYHGLHYDASTRTVSFTAEKIKAGCELTVGIITKTPATVDDPNTAQVETRRDFYNTAFAAEKDVTAISNTVHAWIGASSTRVYRVRYAYTGSAPAGAPATPSEQSYAENSEVAVSANPTLEGYTFSGWTTTDATVSGGSFEMPGQDVQLVGVWTKNAAATKYAVTYVINGSKPADFMPPAQKEYEAGVSVPLDSTETNAVIDGYRFSGWSTQDVALSETGFTMPAQNVTIVGSFVRISYTVCYEFEGAIMPDNADSLLPPCETHYPGDTVTTANNPTTSGYEFLGWYKNSTFTMPEENVIIQGEWSRAMGKFAPTITKTIVNPKDEYMYGETVEFKITVTNTAAFEITDVYLEGKLPGAVFTESPDNSYTVRTDTVAVIPSIAAGASVDVYAEYKVTANIAQTLTNIVELTGALADGYTLDTDQEYEAEVDFDTVPEPAPVTGIIFNTLPYVGLMAIGISVIFIGITLSRKTSGVVARLARIHNLDMHRAVKYSLPCFAIVGVLIGGFIAKNVSAEHYTEVIKSIELTSQHTSYANGDPGSWNVTKSAGWISQNKARITFNINTIANVAENTHLDIVMVLDNSGSMGGNKLAQVKSDSSDLVETILSDAENRIALISFNNNAVALNEFTNNASVLLDKIDQLSASGGTSYYSGLQKAEAILNDYARQAGRELVLLFLTDGYPNEQTPNEIAEYRLLKRRYPYMAVNGIQYEMGDEVLDPIKAISDNQFIADMASLNNVLFEASIAPYVYDSFVLTDYIDSENWDVDSIDAIEASIGETSLAYDGGTPVVTWAMNGALMSGHSAQLTIDITLKNAGAIEENTYLPTNDHETIQTSLPETPDENITSELTPVLKSSYKVIYEPNLPSDCNTYGGILPAEHNYLPLIIVQKSSDVISCDGYNFAGWIIVDGEPKIINDDYFKINDDDVALWATWTKVSIAKRMDGEVKEEVAATLDSGQNINKVMKQLSGQSDATYSTSNTSIIAIKTASSMIPEQQANASTISVSGSPVPIYAWFNDADGAIYVYSEADVIRAGTNLSYLAYNMKGLVDIEALASWDTSSTTNLGSMFYGASSLADIDALSGWNTSSVTSMGSMFRGASSLTDIDALSGWDTSKVSVIGSMFYDASNLANIDGASNWNTSKVTNMNSMFRNAVGLANIDGASDWNTSSVTSMSFMFYGASGLANIDGASNWNTSKVTDMNCMFDYASNLANIDGASNWNTSKVTNMSYMFQGASSLANIDGASNWNTSKVTNMSDMFSGASSLADIDGASNWDTSKVTSVRNMFKGASGLTDIDDISNWNTSSVTNMSSMFRGASRLANIDGASSWVTSSVTTMEYMFYDASSLANIDGASNWNTSSVTDMSSMFSGASSLANIDGASNWNTFSVTDMGYMFDGASSLNNINGASNWNTSSVTSMSNMFYGASSLTNINGASNWSTSNVTTMGYMFAAASALADIDALEGWNTANVTNMEYMFNGAISITSLNPIFDWDISSLTYKDYMFNGIPGSVTRPPWGQGGS